MDRGSNTNGHRQDTPPPPPRPPPHQQLLQCSSLGNNYRLPNSYPSSMVSQQWNNAKANAVVQSQTVSRHAVQTQTETKLSCLRQFLYCLLANEVINTQNLNFQVKKKLEKKCLNFRAQIVNALVRYLLCLLSKNFSIAKLARERKNITCNLQREDGPS